MPNSDSVALEPMSDAIERWFKFVQSIKAKEENQKVAEAIEDWENMPFEV